MNLNEYNKVKDFSYEEYCKYLKNKYGPVLARYSQVNTEKYARKEEGLFVHHIKENVAAGLSDNGVAKENGPLYQEPENLVYCNYLEHLFLHILIGKETALDKNLGLNGVLVHIIPALIKFYDREIRDTRINENYYKVIKDNKATFNVLFDLYNNLIENIDFTLDHNITLYNQVEECLDTKGRALVVLGTGLGKTTTALQYLVKRGGGEGRPALVVAPNNLIKTCWENNKEYVEVTTYQSFANKYKEKDYSNYSLVILDEAHHVDYDENIDKGAKVWGKPIKYLIDNKIIKVLGLTATPERTDNIDVGSTLFKDCVCEGLSIEEAIEQKIVYPFSYVTALYDTKGIMVEYKDCGNRELVGQLGLAINNTLTMKEVFKKYMPTGKRKGIIFIQKIEDKEYALDIFKDIYPNAEYRAIDSKMKEEVEINKKWFQDIDEGYLIAVDMISEGAHYSRVTTLIMFRRTSSYLVYAQQLGRIITLTKKENPNAIVFDLVNNADNVKYNDRKINRNKKTHSVARLLEVIKKQAEKSNQIIVADETREIVDVIRKIKDYNQLRIWDHLQEEWLYNNYKNYDSRELAIIGFKKNFFFQ